MRITTDKYNKRTTPAANLKSLLTAKENKMPINVEQYAQSIEKLIYTIILTRPDITFTLERLSQFIKNSVKRYKHALKWLL